MTIESNIEIENTTFKKYDEEKITSSVYYMPLIVLK